MEFVLLEDIVLPDGVVDVTEVEENVEKEKERVYHARLDAPVEVEVGTTAGLPVYTATDYFIVVDVDYEEEISEEEAQILAMQGHNVEPGLQTHDLAAIIVSNEDGEPGAVIHEIVDGTAQDAIDYLGSL